MRPHRHTKPNNFEDSILEILNDFRITAFHDNKNIDKYDLGLVTTKGRDFLQFDIIAVIGTIGILFEATRVKSENTSKMKQFNTNCKDFVSSTKSPSKKIRLFTGIPSSKRSEFNKIKKWRFIYVSDQSELIIKTLNERNIGNPSNFHILNKYHIRYLKFLCKNLGKYGKNELLNKFRISFKEAKLKGGTDSYPAVEVLSKKISSKIGHVDLYLFSAPVFDLLNITRVDRYGSLGNWIPETGTESYQRLLYRDKISELHEFIHKNKEDSSFPNTITVVINKPSKYKNKELELQQIYGCLDIIDGQHRLFAFANSGLNEEQLKNAEVLVTAIKFKTASKSEIKKWNARTFVEINSTQRKVSTDLIYLLRYKVMKENLPVGLATEAIKRMNSNNKYTVYSLFKTGPFSDRSEKGTARIKIVTIAKELTPLFTIGGNEIPNVTKAESTISNRVQQLDSFFEDFSNIFKEDWKDGPKNSLIFTTNYMATFCNVFIRCKKQKLSKTKISIKLKRLRANLGRPLKKHNPKAKKFDNMYGPKGEIFWEKNPLLPRPSNLSHVKKLILKNSGFRV